MPSATGTTITSMQISRMFVYPIKSCRAYEPTSAQLDRHGFKHDRTFMLLARQPDGTLKNMHVAHFPEMVLLSCSAPDSITNPSTTITYHPPKGSSKKQRSIELSLEPGTRDLEEFEVEMHKSPTKAFNMGEKYNTFISECLDREVVLAYLGPNLRSVLMSSPSNAPPPSSTTASSAAPGAGWLSSLTNKLPTSVSGILGSGTEEDKITFADCAPYLVVSEKSMDNVSSRLPEGEEMDITKFRPNIIVSGAEQPWEEDLWAEIEIHGQGETAARVHCSHNCARCTSINVDYETGQFGKQGSGQMLKMLQKDRRIDKGMKYSPVFGRYSFVAKASEGTKIRVGDEVRVTRRNEQNTLFDWRGLATI